MPKRVNNFSRGFVCAVAEVLRTRGDTATACEILNCMGKIHRRDIDYEDWEVLVKHKIATPGADVVWSGHPVGIGDEAYAMVKAKTKHETLRNSARKAR